MRTPADDNELVTSEYSASPGTHDAPEALVPNRRAGLTDLAVQGRPEPLDAWENAKRVAPTSIRGMLPYKGARDANV